MLAYEMYSETCESYRFAWQECHRELNKEGKDRASGLEVMRAEMGLGRVETLAEKIDRKLGVR